ncbi:MAG: transglycosylase domain-containing protein, partial [Marinobacter sp.]|nr:transglycosylase domain-containing protein [Marinobacter sp.]
MKKSASPKKRAPRRSAKQSPNRRNGFWRLVGRLALVGIIILAGWTVYLDAVVTDRFEGRRFEVPSRVYARPLELYEGATMTEASLRQELSLSGYQRVRAQRAGTYTESGGRFVINTRGFRFADGPEPQRQLSVTIANGQISGFQVLSGPDAALARLEPAQIGGIYPAHKEDRILVTLADLPPTLEPALLAVEDRNFYDHIGIAPLS